MSAIGSISSSQALLANQVNMAVMKKGQDIAKTQGQAAVSLVQQAAELQQNLTAGSSGKGQLIDVLA